MGQSGVPHTRRQPRAGSHRPNTNSVTSAGGSSPHLQGGVWGGRGAIHPSVPKLLSRCTHASPLGLTPGRRVQASKAARGGRQAGRARGSSAGGSRQPHWTHFQAHCSLQNPTSLPASMHAVPQPNRSLASTSYLRCDQAGLRAWGGGGRPSPGGSFNQFKPSGGPANLSINFNQE